MQPIVMVVFLLFYLLGVKNVHVPYKGVPVKTIKRFIADASESEVIEAIREKDFSPRDDNQADALALMFYVMERY